MGLDDRRGGSTPSSAPTGFSGPAVGEDTTPTHVSSPFSGSPTLPADASSGAYDFGGDDPEEEEGGLPKWLLDVQKQVYKDLEQIGKDWGIGFDQIYGVYSSNIRELSDYLQYEFMPSQDAYAFSFGGLGSDYYTGTYAGAQFLNDYARRFFEAKFSGLDFDAKAPSRGGSGRSGGGGAVGPTEDEIRNMFDLDALATAATNIWRGLLLEEPEDSRGLARAYVDSIVASGAEKEIDFEQFIRTRVKDTARYASIYKRKPDSYSEEQFLQPYFQAASQMTTPGRAASVAIGGAQFAASGQQFMQRLNREDSVTGSAPYISALQQKMTGVNGILKG